jgi:hypothetical protein
MAKWMGLFAALLASTASAHDWYEDRSDPVTGKTCCGGHDCRAIPSRDVQALANGGFRYKPYNYYIPPERVQPSPDEQYHLCDPTALLSSPSAPERSKIPGYLKRWICFFAPRLTN